MLRGEEAFVACYCQSMLSMHFWIDPAARVESPEECFAWRHSSCPCATELDCWYCDVEGVAEVGMIVSTSPKDRRCFLQYFGLSHRFAPGVSAGIGSSLDLRHSHVLLSLSWAKSRAWHWRLRRSRSPEHVDLPRLSIEQHRWRPLVRCLRPACQEEASLQFPVHRSVVASEAHVFRPLC